MATQAERRERTRAAIVTAATTRFRESGFEATSIADILHDAEVSRGALYHHFASKEDVFAAVFTAVSRDAIRRATKKTRHAENHLDALIGGCVAWLDISVEPQVATLLFVEGPRALGWDRCRELEDDASLGRMRAGLAAATKAGEADVENVELTARVINAALTEVALSIHRQQPRTTGAAARRTITSLITGLTS